MSFDPDTLRAAVAEHAHVVRVLVAGGEGSAPREPGAAMLVWRGGQSGTIGGGRLEWEAAGEARNMIGRVRGMVQRVPLGPALGQCCGGRVALVYEAFDAQHLPKPEERAYLRRITGTEEAPLALKRHAALARNAGAQVPVRLEQGWLIEPVATVARPLWIFGAGHVGRALLDVLAPLLELAITWVDTAPERFPATIPNGVTQLVAANPADVVRHAPTDAAHLVLTYSHAFDLELCHQLLGHGFSSAGLIGSQTKWARFRARLADLGHTPEQIARITCPIGDPALGKHPQAIAIGVAAAILHQTTQAEEVSCQSHS